MNNQELAALCRIEIRRWQSVPDKQYLVDLLEAALAALTAEPVKVPDQIESVSGSHFDDYYCDGWNACREELLRLNAIDNTAQQYEALAGKSETPPPPEPPTAPPIYIGNKPVYIRKPEDKC